MRTLLILSPFFDVSCPPWGISFYHSYLSKLGSNTFLDLNLLCYKKNKLFWEDYEKTKSTRGLQESFLYFKQIIKDSILKESEKYDSIYITGNYYFSKKIDDILKSLGRKSIVIDSYSDEKQSLFPPKFCPENFISAYSVYSQDFSCFDGSLYNQPNSLEISTSFGCLNRCSFCVEKRNHPKIVLKNPKDIIHEINQSLKYHKIDSVYYGDASLNNNLDHLDEVLACSRQLGLMWEANMIIRPEMNYKFFTKLKASGCRALHIGIESFSKRVLKHNGKTMALKENFEEIIKDAEKAGIKLNCNIMFGLPGETESDFRYSLEKIKNLASEYCIFNPSYSCCTFDENTPKEVFQNLGISIPICYDVINECDIIRYDLWFDSESNAVKRNSRLLYFIATLDKKEGYFFSEKTKKAIMARIFEARKTVWTKLL